MPKSIIGLFEETVARHPNKVAARFKDKAGQWTERTWAQFSAERMALASGLVELGLLEDERVNILSNTSYAWMVADAAIPTAGGESVAIYQSNLADECEYIINDCAAAMVFVEDKEQLAKVLSSKTRLASVRKVIVMNDETDGTSWTTGLSDVVRIGKEHLKKNEPDLVRRTSKVVPEDLLTLIYTSGTTGRPKGVMLTHANFLYIARAVEQVSGIRHDDVQLLFLPMAHVFARCLQCVWFQTGHEMAIDPDTTAITANMAVIRPTIMASVPRIFEKVYGKITAGGLSSPGLKGKLFQWALHVTDQHAQLLAEKKPVPLGVEVQLALAKKLVFSKIHAKLWDLFGGRLRYFVSGGAPLSRKIALFFSHANIKIVEGYGLTETSAATCVNPPDKVKIGTVGPAVPGMELKIAPDGEILIRGPGVMKGYWNQPEATKEVLTPDGWFKSGDIGEIDEDGYLKITDRKKDIIVTAGGKNVSPQNIENILKASSPLISQAMVVGDRRKYLVVLVTLEAEALKKFCTDHGIQGDFAAMTQADAVKREVETIVQGVNAQLPQYETLKRFLVLDRDFVVGDELTPTLKVKRKHASTKYQAAIESLYEERLEH